MTPLATGGASWRFDVTTASAATAMRPATTASSANVRGFDVSAASATAATARCFECARLLRVLTLEGLHRLRVLAL